MPIWAALCEPSTRLTVRPNFEPGLLSGDGWMILDDSDDNLVVEASEVNGSPNPFGSWVARKPVSSTDLYFFGYARRIHDACMTITSSPDRSSIASLGVGQLVESLSSLQRNRISYADRTF
ncbi:MAG: hypothetical protein ACLT4Y_06475 [Bifidobacterium breve]